MRQSLEQFILDAVRKEGTIGFRRVWSLVKTGAGRDETLSEVAEAITTLKLDGYVAEPSAGIYETVKTEQDARTPAEVQCGHALPMSQRNRAVC